MALIADEEDCMNPSEITQYLVESTTSVKHAIERLDRLPTKLLLVVNSKKLIGSVTDGDIRRALMSHFSLDISVAKIMNNAPKTLAAKDSTMMAKGLIQKFGISAVPVVNTEGEIIDLLQDDKHLIQKRDNAVFLMAGGFGTRLRPLTNDCPKPMLRVGDKPILETIMEQFVSRGFHNFYISTHYLNEQIESHFGDGEDFGVTISYVHEENPLGTAGAIGLLPESAKEKSLILMNGDLLTNLMFDEFLDYHLEESSGISVGVKEYQYQVPFGVISHQGNRVQEIIEKPIQSEFINAGIYCISPQVLNQVRTNEYLDMPTLIQNQLDLGNNVSMFPIHEYWLDIGRYSDYQKAQSEYYSCFNKNKSHLQLVENG